MGLSDNPDLRKLLGWNPLAPKRPRLPGMMAQEDVDLADEEEPPLGPFSEDHAPHDPETVHVDQQLAAISKSPTITPAAGSTRKPASFYDVPGMIGEAASGLAGIGRAAMGHGFGPEFPDLSIAHAAGGGGGAPSAPIMDDAERMRRAAQINERSRVATPSAPAAAHPTDAAALTRHTPSTVPLDNVYGNEDLAIEHAAGPSRGGYMGGQKLEDVAYLPDSVLEEAANRRMLADVQRKPGELSASQQSQIQFGKEQGEIKFAAMDKIVDEEAAKAIAAGADPQKVSARAADKKLYYRQVGMAGWPRQSEFDPVTGEPMTFGAAPGGR